MSKRTYELDWEDGLDDITTGASLLTNGIVLLAMSAFGLAKHTYNKFRGVENNDLVYEDNEADEGEEPEISGERDDGDVQCGVEEHIEEEHSQEEEKEEERLNTMYRQEETATLNHVVSEGGEQEVMRSLDASAPDVPVLEQRRSGSPRR